MKKNTHPKYYENATIRCACGNTLKVGSTKENIEVEVCASCHPFFTGKGRIIDVSGRVEKFKRRAAKKAETPSKKKEKRAAKSAAEPKKKKSPKSPKNK